MIIKPVTTPSNLPQSSGKPEANPRAGTYAGQATENVAARQTLAGSGANSAIGSNPLTSQQGNANVEQAVSRVADYAQGFQRDLQFSVSKDHGETIIKVIDTETEEVIREIPPEELLELAERLEAAAGLLVADEA